MIGNDRLEANNFFTNSAGLALAKAKFPQNQFGGAIGGRIIPDKTFFFTEYYGALPTTAAASSIGSVPPPSIRDGDLAALQSPIFDPLARRLQR